MEISIFIDSSDIYRFLISSLELMRRPFEAAQKGNQGEISSCISNEIKQIKKQIRHFYRFLHNFLEEFIAWNAIWLIQQREKKIM